MFICHFYNIGGHSEVLAVTSSLTSSRSKKFTLCTTTICFLYLYWNWGCADYFDCSHFHILVQLIMTSSNGNIFRVTGLLCGEFTGHRWIRRPKAIDADLWSFLWFAPWINGWVNNRAHYDVTVTYSPEVAPEITIYPKKYSRFRCALLCCGYVIVHNEFKWSIYPYSSGLLCWHWGNR